MQTSRRTLTAFFATFALAALAALFAVPSLAGSKVPAESQAAVVKPGKIGVQACRSNPYYAARQLNFRATISRQQLNVKQQLAVKVEVWRRLNEQKKFRKLKLDGEKGWNVPRDLDVAIYQHDVIVDANAIETRAQYKAKATFRWSDPNTEEVIAKKTMWSKPCKQRTSLPKLRLKWVRSVQVPGENKVTHTLSVSNSGYSEAVNVPVDAVSDSLSDPSGAAGSAVIDSVGPQQVESVSITVASCRNWTNASIGDPQFGKGLLGRPGVIWMGTLGISQCK